MVRTTSVQRYVLVCGVRVSICIWFPKKYFGMFPTLPACWTYYAGVQYRVAESGECVTVREDRVSKYMLRKKMAPRYKKVKRQNRRETQYEVQKKSTRSRMIRIS